MYKARDKPLSDIEFTTYFYKKPRRADIVNEILSDAESISLIKKGLVGVKAHEYTDKKYHKNCGGFDWCDL